MADIYMCLGRVWVIYHYSTLHKMQWWNMMESISLRFYALYCIPKINAYDWTFPHLTECMCGGELNQKGKILINQAVRVKIDHLDNNVLGSRVPGRVLLAFSCRGRGGAANCCQLALQMDAPVCNLHSHVFNDGAPVYQRQRVIEFIRVCLYLY